MEAGMEARLERGWEEDKGEDGRGMEARMGGGWRQMSRIISRLIPVLSRSYPCIINVLSPSYLALNHRLYGRRLVGTLPQK